MRTSVRVALWVALTKAALGVMPATADPIQIVGLSASLVRGSGNPLEVVSLTIRISNAQSTGVFVSPSITFLGKGRKVKFVNAHYKEALGETLPTLLLDPRQVTTYTTVKLVTNEAVGADRVDVEVRTPWGSVHKVASIERKGDAGAAPTPVPEVKTAETPKPSGEAKRPAQNGASRCICVDISEPFLEDAMEIAVANHTVIVASLDKEPGTGRRLDIEVGPPITPSYGGPSRILIKVKGEPPRPGTRARLILPVEAVMDNFLNALEEPFDHIFEWPKEGGGQLNQQNPGFPPCRCDS